MLAMAAALLSLLMLAPPSAEWEQWAKLMLAVALPVAVGLAFMVGVVVLVFWKGIQTGKGAWRTMAREWVGTEEFRNAVNTTRENAELRFTLLMKETIDSKIKEHDEDENAHGAIMRNRRAGD